MFNILYEDLLLLLLYNLTDITDVINLSTIDQNTNKSINNDIYIWWGRNMYSTEFWNRANNRSSIVSKPLLNMKMELLRIKKFTDFQIKYGQEVWTKDDYYKYWNSMEKFVDKKLHFKNTDIDYHLEFNSKSKLNSEVKYVPPIQQSIYTNINYNNLNYLNYENNIYKLLNIIYFDNNKLSTLNIK
jgi:hypothetical protein